jgi:anti-sigma28 factor (negative regulator of flagellin synthesis)
MGMRCRWLHLTILFEGVDGSEVGDMKALKSVTVVPGVLRQADEQPENREQSQILGMIELAEKVRRKRIEQIRVQVRAGNYVIDCLALAQKMFSTVEFRCL